MLKRTIAKIVVAGFGLSLLPALSTPAYACGYFTGFEDCGENKAKPIIRLQPAPEEPWVWPEEGALAPFIWNPYAKRDNRKFNVPPPKKIQPKPVKCLWGEACKPVKW